MPRSKTLKLFLMDGEPSGRIKCSLANWTGIAYKIPRTALDRCKDLDILKQSGVYFLFGTDKTDNAVVYIGQAGAKVFFCGCRRPLTPLTIGRRQSCSLRQITLSDQRR